MEGLDNLTFQTLERYFTVLEKVGYIKDGDVNKVILLTFLRDIVENFQYYLTEEDYNTINNILACLYGSSCLIPFAQYRKISEPIDNFVTDTPIRISEEVQIRHSQEDEERLVNN